MLGHSSAGRNYKGPAENYEASGDDLPRRSSEHCYMSIKVLNSWPVSLQIVSSHGWKTLFKLLQEIDQVQIKIPVVLGVPFLWCHLIQSLQWFIIKIAKRENLKYLKNNWFPLPWTLIPICIPIYYWAYNYHLPRPPNALPSKARFTTWL
jgi:hypothetical protein